MEKEYRNVARTKKQIRRAFTELLGERKNIEDISVTALAERADIAKSTFYYHYTDIYGVAEEFENELLAKLGEVFQKMESDRPAAYDVYVKMIIAYLQENEEMYRTVIGASNIKLFIEKLKAIMAQKVFERDTLLPYSNDPAVKYVQIRFLTNACVDTVADYFRGKLPMTLSQVGEVILQFLEKVR